MYAGVWCIPNVAMNIKWYDVYGPIVEEKCYEWIMLYSQMFNIEFISIYL